MQRLIETRQRNCTKKTLQTDTEPGSSMPAIPALLGNLMTYRDCLIITTIFKGLEKYGGLGFNPHYQTNEKRQNLA